MKDRLGSALHAILLRHMDAGEIAGGVVLVAKNGVVEALDAVGHADVDPDFRLNPDSIFNLMSMTKPVAAACAAILIAQGVVLPDDPVSKWLPEFAQPRMVRTLRSGETYRFETMGTPDQAAQREPDFDYAPANRAITLHDLLNFTSGLQTIGIANPALPPVLPTDTLSDWVGRLGAVPLEFQPGAQWHYSNATGYDVVGRIVEVASGMPFSEFAKRRLFDPLEMHDTAFGARDWMMERLVPLGPLARLHVARPGYDSGSAGLFSTVRDYAKFAQMLLDDGRYAGRTVMPAKAVEMMRSNQIGDLGFPGFRAVQYARPITALEGEPGSRYGYGVGIVAEPSATMPLPAGSYGWDGIGTRRFWVIPSRQTIIVMLIPGLGFAADATHRDIEALVAGSD